MSSERHPAPRKSLGQHFLTDANIARKIVGLLQLEPGDRVLEIGPGQGALTRHLVALPLALLCTLEKDSHWAHALPRSLPGLRMIHGDAMTMDWGRLRRHGGWKLVSNLPYNVASPLLWDIAAAGGFTRGVFMVQKEVAQRLAAAPHNKQYGALTVWVQSFARVRLAFTVPPGAFRPPPKVDSAVFVLEPREVPLAVERGALSHVLHLCFQKRRKQLRSILKPLYPGLDPLLESLGLTGTERPEDLTVETFNLLARSLKSGIVA